MKRIAIVSFVLLFACLPLFSGSEDLSSSTLSLSINASSSPRYEIGLSSSPVSDISSVVSPKSNLTLIGKDNGGGKIVASDSAHIYWKIVSTNTVNILLVEPEPLSFSSATGESTIPLTIIIGSNSNPDYDHEFNRNGTSLKTEILGTKSGGTLSVGNSVSVSASASIDINALGDYSSSNYTSSLNIIVEVVS